MSVSQRKDGRWVCKYKTPDGIWKQRAFRDEQQARAFDVSNAPVEDSHLSLGEVVAAYLRAHPDMYHATRERIVWLLADGGPFCVARDKYADALNRTDLELLREAMRARNASNNTINKYQAYIHAALAWAADQELIKANPWRDFKRLKLTRKIINPSMQDFLRIYGRLNPDYKWAVRTAFFLSLRPGDVELFSLTWDAFNWRSGSVAVIQGKSGRLKTVYPAAAYLDEAQRRYTSDKARGIPYVCHRNGHKILSFRSAWQRAERAVGIKMRPYMIRHLSASVMLANGADLAAVAAQLGHASVATTGSTYAHVMASGQQRAASVMPSLPAPE